MPWELKNLSIVRKIIDLKLEILPGDYKAYVGPPHEYDLLGAHQFNLLTSLGLREKHSLLDIGCGSLKAGRLFIPYLLPGKYFGIEPAKWLIKKGVKNELGDDMIRIKRPTFNNDNKFTLSIFNQKFDFILASGIFTHASQKQIRRCLSEAKKVMKPDSIFAANFSKGRKNYEGNQWLYYTDTTAHYTLDKIIHLAKEQDLVCEPINYKNPFGLTWVAFVNPKG